MSDPVGTSKDSTGIEDELTPEELEELRRRYAEYKANPPTLEQLRQPNLLDDLLREFKDEDFTTEELDEIAIHHTGY